MKVCIISFSENGRRLSEDIAEKVSEMNKMSKSNETKIETCLFTKYTAYANEKCPDGQPVFYVEDSVAGWAKKQMEERNALLFIGACGIAVRAVAPHLTDKLHDSPVLVMDECGKYVIPVLSGHMGGANALAVCLAEQTGAEPVITTATDCNGKFAIDLFAKRKCLYIANKDGIARVSAKVLAGKVITISVETGYECSLVWESGVPEYVCIVPYPPARPVDVLIASGETVSDAALLLRPKEYVIGMGCKKGKSADDIEDFICRKLRELGIFATQIFALASISQKRDEPGLIQWCQKEGVRFLTYTAEELQAVEGTFVKSSFVREQVGVDNVCERAAVKACGLGGKLVLEKCAENGMTIAIAKKAGFQVVGSRGGL